LTVKLFYSSSLYLPDFCALLLPAQCVVCVSQKNVWSIFQRQYLPVHHVSYK
jgi:hypothetical protein